MKPLEGLPSADASADIATGLLEREESIGPGGCDFRVLLASHLLLDGIASHGLKGRRLSGEQEEAFG